MNTWKVFTQKDCKYCEKAKELLVSYNFIFDEIEVNSENKDEIYSNIDEYTNKYRYFPIIFN